MSQNPEQENHVVDSADHEPESSEATLTPDVGAQVDDPSEGLDASEPEADVEAAHSAAEVESDGDSDGDDSDGDDSDGDDSDGDDSDGDDSDGDDSDGDDSTEPATGKRAATVARLEREGEIAADFLEKLLDIADLDGDLDVDVEGERAVVAIVDSADGRVPRRLVGTNGEVLEALQELSRLAVQARTGDRSRLMLDVAGHRARRREQLVGVAQDAVAKVKESGEPLTLDPMNPFERKIVHDAVAAAGLSSESEGVDPGRRIVVQPA